MTLLAGIRCALFGAVLQKQTPRIALIYNLQIPGVLGFRKGAAISPPYRIEVAPGCCKGGVLAELNRGITNADP